MNCTVFMVIFLLGVISSAGAGMDKANEAYERGDYALAYREFLPLAEDGDAIAQFRIGSMYMNGFGSGWTRGHGRDDGGTTGCG